MNQAARCLILALAGMIAAGCDGFTIALEPKIVTVSLVNASAYPVEGTVYTSDDQDLAVIGLIGLGEDQDFRLEADTTYSFSGSCDEIQAVMVDDVELRVVGGIGPEANSSVLTDGDDFSCGDTIVFTFTHSDLLTDFDVFVSVR